MYISSSLWTVSKCTLTGSAPTYGFHKLRVGPGTCIFNHISNWFLSLRIGGKSSEGNVVSLSEAGVNGLTQICFQKHSGCYWREGWELGEWRQSGRHAVIHMNHEETDNDGRDGGEAKNLCGFLAGSNDLHTRWASGPSLIFWIENLIHKTPCEWQVVTEAYVTSLQIVARNNFMVPSEKMLVPGVEVEGVLKHCGSRYISLPRAHKQTNHMYDSKYFAKYTF